MSGLFLVAAAAFILRDDDKALFLRRSLARARAPGEWETPNGRLEPGESVVNALVRAVGDATGLDIELVRPVDTWRTLRDTPDGAQETIGITYLCRHYGSGDVRLSAGHDSYWWVPLRALEQFPIDPALRDAVRPIVAELVPDESEGERG